MIKSELPILAAGTKRRNRFSARPCRTISKKPSRNLACRYCNKSICFRAAEVEINELVELSDEPRRISLTCRSARHIEHDKFEVGQESLLDH